MTDIPTLISMLEKAEAGGRELDAHLFAYVNGGRIHWISETSGELVWEKPIDGFWIRRPSHLKKMPRYSQSLDAAVALVARLLPGWNWWLGRIGRAAVDRKNPHSRFEAINPIPAIALCLAALKALEEWDKPTI